MHRHATVTEPAKVLSKQDEGVVHFEAGKRYTQKGDLHAASRE